MVDVSEIARFTPGERTLRLVMDIAAALERYRIVMEGPSGVRLRKLNHVRTIRGTTAIEGNTLTEAQVTDIIAGKRVVGSKREIDEVKGAHAAYSKVELFDPLSLRALLRAHALMTKNLVGSSGKWRKCNVGVFNARGEAIHHAPPWDQVPFLMKDLFGWLKHSKDVPLVKSCIFHFVFETIHPFSDGNGRMGRLWQTVILGQWNSLFYALPIENMVLCHQRRYYQTLHSAQESGDARVFVDFMLDMILRTLKARGESQDGKKYAMKVAIISFSFKRGLPEDKTGNGGGFVFDCRAMPNPYWDESLRCYTGRDKPIRDFFDQHKDIVDNFLGATETLVRQSIDEYIKDGRDHLQVAFGCTGGQHRSVYFAERMADTLRKTGAVEVEVVHAAKPYWKVANLTLIKEK